MNQNRAKIRSPNWQNFIKIALLYNVNNMSFRWKHKIFFQTVPNLLFYGMFLHCIWHVLLVQIYQKKKFTEMEADISILLQVGCYLLSDRINAVLPSGGTRRWFDVIIMIVFGCWHFDRINYFMPCLENYKAINSKRHTKHIEIFLKINRTDNIINILTCKDK